MSNNAKDIKKRGFSQKRPIIITSVGMIIMIILIIATLDISHRGTNSFISAQEQYILGVEGFILVVLIVELLVRLTTLGLNYPLMIKHGPGLRLVIRIVGYSIGSLLVISVLASNPTLGISVGAIAGIAIAFATQNIVGSVLGAILLLTTRMVRVGEEITLGQTKGKVADINLTHTILSVDDEVVFIPNSLMISSVIRRKKRDAVEGASVKDW